MDGGLEVGRVVRQVSRLLDSVEAGRVAELLPYLRFWELPVCTEDEGFDGTTWELEGVSRGRYHVAHR
jgi:hypothetical protein